MITDTELKKVAKLIRVRIQDDELPEIAKQVSKIIDFAEQLSEVECDDVEIIPGGHTGSMYERADVVTAGNMPEKVLSNAHSVKYNMFAVPKIVE